MKYPITKTFQVSEKMQMDLESMPQINVAATCRNALQAEIDIRRRAGANRKT